MQGRLFMPSNLKRPLNYVEAIREAFDQSMAKDSNVIVIGEGVPDPKAIFGSTAGLREKYGDSRVFDMPLSENGLTGICIGAAISGLRPVLIHQRIDFALLSIDQLFNNAAKWHYMFNGKATVPIVVRMIVGRGWGQGPQHSQSLQALFALIPGLKVVMPTTAHDAKGMLNAAIQDNNPVIFIEHRWLHPVVDDVPEEYYEVPLDKAKIIQSGKDLTLAAFSYMTLESLVAVRALKEVLGIEVELIDMRSIRPLDVPCVRQSVQKTGHLIVADTAYKTGSIGAELISQLVESDFVSFKSAPIRIASPDFPTPTAPSMTDGYYPTPVQIADAVLTSLGRSVSPPEKNQLDALLVRKSLHDVPSHDFVGPF